MRVAYLAIVTALLALATFSIIPKDAYPHSMGQLPIRVDTHTFHMKPGDTQTEEMRICSMLPDELVVNNVTFNGTNSDWAHVDEEQFPITAAPEDNLTASVSVPVTVTVPSNFTGNHALIQTIVNTESPLPLPVQGNLIIFIGNSTVASQNLPACKSLLDIQRDTQYSSVVVGSIGAGLIAAGYFMFRYSKTKSQKQKAGIGAKVLLILLAIIGSFLILGALLSLRL